MTKGDVVAQGLSEATGKPLSEIKRAFIQIALIRNPPPYFHDELSDEAAALWLAELRKDLPALKDRFLNDPGFKTFFNSLN